MISQKTKEILNFLFVGCLILILITLINRNFVFKKLYAHENFKLPADVSVLIVGDSHLETSLDPQYIQKTVSVAHSGEGYFFNFYKLKIILDVNPQIKKIVLGYSHKNISQGAEKYMFDPEINNSFLDQYFVLLDDEGRKVLQKNTYPYWSNWCKLYLGVPIELHSRMNLISRMFLNRKDLSKYNFWGGHTPIERSNSPESAEKSLARHYYDHDHQLGVSPLMLKYLERIITFCQDKGITVVLVNTPVTPEYLKGVPEIHKKTLAEKIKILKKKYSNVEYFDFHQLKMDEKYFLDADHLNQSGAEIFSKRINALLFPVQKTVLSIN